MLSVQSSTEKLQNWLQNKPFCSIKWPYKIQHNFLIFWHSHRRPEQSVTTQKLPDYQVLVQMGLLRAVWVSEAEMVEMEMSLVEGTLLVGQAKEEKTIRDR